MTFLSHIAVSSGDLRLMEVLPGILKLAAGAGLFLFAMHLLEQSLKNLSGRSFKLFLQRVTHNRLGAAAGGAAVTAVLQSSSMVTAMVLGFVGAGVFTAKNAMAIILGANLGTTIDSWLVATLGFKVDLELVAYPAVFAGGLLLVIFNHKKALQYLAYFLFGFGLLFIALSFMKTALQDEVKSFDLYRYHAMPAAAFLGIGFMVTLLVQSSSVTMALTLSALHAGAVSFPSAAAIVLGSEVGTSMKTVLNAIGGDASKKRVILGNLIFNGVLTIFSFLFLGQILQLITKVLGISDPLIGLVTFSSLVNLLGIVIFLPFLEHYTNLLSRFFKDSDESAVAFIVNAGTNEPETALHLLHMETEFFIQNAILFNLDLLGERTDNLCIKPEFTAANARKKFFMKPGDEKYAYMKQLQGEIQMFYLELRPELEGEPRNRLEQMVSAVRSAMYAMKCTKDVGSNIDDLNRSSKDIKHNFFLTTRQENQALYIQLLSLLKDGKINTYQSLKSLLETVLKNYTEALNGFYGKAGREPIGDLDITTVINFNRELFTANKAMIMAVKDLLLNEQEAEEFNEIPSYRA